jgi:predicted PurR-regulated permease PerM
LIPPNRPPTSSQLLTLITIVVVVGGLYLGRQVLIPFALALVFTFLLTPLVSRLERYRLGRVPAVLVALALGLVLLAALGSVVTTQVVQITRQLPSYKDNLEKKVESIRGARNGSLSKASAGVKEIDKDLAAPRQEANEQSTAPADRPVPVQVAAAPSSAFQYLETLLGPLVGLVRTVGIVTVFTLFMLVKREDLRNRIIRLAGQGRLRVTTRAMDDAAQRLSRYLLMQFWVNSGYGLVFGTGLYFIGVPHAVLWGVLAGLLRFLPYLGAMIGAALPTLFALAVFPGWSHAALALGLFLVMELTTANAIEPWLYGAHTGISSLAILVAAVFWAMLWGPVGLILSTPLCVCLIVLGRYVPQFEFLVVLLGDEPALSPDAHFYQRLLALDEKEASDIAQEYAKEKGLQAFYESVLIPALSLAEQDRHLNMLDEDTENFIYQCTMEVIEELGKQADPETSQAGSTQGGSSTATSSISSADTGRSNFTVVSVPAGDEADGIMATVVTQLLQRIGYRAQSVPIGTVEGMLQRASELGARVICVSALEPFALGHAHSLCKRLRGRLSEVKIVLGLWNFGHDITDAEERLGRECVDAVATTLAEALVQVRQLAGTATAGADLLVGLVV